MHDIYNLLKNDEVRFIPTDFNNLLRVLMRKPDSYDFEEDEKIEAQWIGDDELTEYNIPKSTQDFVREKVRFLAFWSLLHYLSIVLWRLF